MTDKKIRVSVEDSQLNKLNSMTKRLASDMISDSRKYSTSSKEVLKDLESQIRLIEKRNALEKESRLIKLSKSGLDKGSKEYKNQSLIIGKESQEDKLQTRLLRNIIDTIKSTAKTEIREDRSNVEKQISTDKTLNQLGVKGDATIALKRTIQKDILGELGEEETLQNERFSNYGKFGKGVSNVVNTGSNVALSKNMFYGAAGLLAMIPLIGNAAANLAKRTLSSAESVQNAMSSLAVSRRTGIKSSEKYFDRYFDKDVYKMGLTPADLLKTQSELYTATEGKLTNNGRNVNNVIQAVAAKKYMGLSQGELMGVAGVSRFGTGDTNKVFDIVKRNSESQTGMLDLIRTYISTSNRILGVTTNVNEEQIIRTIAGIKDVTGMKGVGLERTVGAFGGLGSSKNPVVRSMMMRAYRDKNPEASFTDIQTMMETPFSKESLPGTQNFLKRLKSFSGGDKDSFKQSLHSAFGGNISFHDIDQMLKGGDLGNLENVINSEKGGKVNFLGKAESQTGVLDKSTALMSSEFQKANMYLSEIPSAIEDVKDAIDQTLKTVTTIEKEKKKNLDVTMDKIVKGEAGILDWLNFSGISNNPFVHP